MNRFNKWILKKVFKGKDITKPDPEPRKFEFAPLDRKLNNNEWVDSPLFEQVDGKCVFKG